MKKYRWGIIGTGKIAHTFAEALAGCEDAEATRANTLLEYLSNEMPVTELRTCLLLLKVEARSML